MIEWWQKRNIRKYSDIIAKINYSNNDASDWIEKCKYFFDSLNQIWNDYYHFQKQNKLLVPEDESAIWPDNKGFQNLLLAQNDTLKVELANSDEVNKLIFILPKIMNHDTLRRENYDPFDISEILIKKSTDEHRQLENAYNRFKTNESDIDLIDSFCKKLTKILYIVRSNIAHGEKTPNGPDLEKTNRDKTVCRIIQPILYKILQIIFDEPLRKLATYGTLQPDESNHDIIKNYTGIWLDATLEGKIEYLNGLPYFEWLQNGINHNIKVLVLEKIDFNWEYLDKFEGESYKRIWIPVKVGNEFIVAQVYEIKK